MNGRENEMNENLIIADVEGLFSSYQHYILHFF